MGKTVSEQGAEKKAPLPQAWGVLYAHPNPDGSRKQCQNCMMWIRRDEDGKPKCMIHPRTLEVTAEMVCGYHVHGAPLEKRMDHPGGLTPVNPRFSGLGVVPGGTTCDLCLYYEAKDEASGLCYAVSKGDEPPLGDPPTPVEAKGCCARWEGREATESVNKLIAKLNEVVRG